ncbi:MAG: MFS transporter [Flavobacteriaceae bacterium]|nr:MFS transporter [Flavobacteriaceae bacterium]
MLTKIIAPYRGLSKEVWFLALTTFINRAGAMVIPFLSLYLTKYLGYTLGQVGWIMTFYGLGSVVGVFFGGKLTDKIGYYKVMYISLFLTGIAFFILQYITSFYLLCAGIFILTVVADAFRPAIWVAMADYSKEENRTRSVTLIRLAINLGFSLGPAIGGLIIANISYQSLFWIDGITCVFAAVLIIKYLYQKSSVVKVKTENKEVKLSPYRDKQYLVFWFAMFLIGFTFMQYFSTIPLFYSQNMKMDEEEIGLLLAMNGFVIFLLEMPIVHAFEKSKLEGLKVVIAGIFLLAISFFVLNISNWIGIVIIGMLFMTFGEMLSFPFSNAYALERAKKGSRGEYMAMYSMSFSVAHILGPNIGMHMSDKYGFAFTWYFMAILLLLACVLIFWLNNLVQKD